MRKIDFTVPADCSGWRVKSVLHRFGVSAALLRKLKVQEDGILKNGSFVRTIDPVQQGDILTVCMYDTGARPTPSGAKIDLLYEDADIIVVDKPAGMPVHESRSHRGDALSNAVASVCPDMVTFRPIYRLDQDTTGLVLAAKNKFAAGRLAGCVDKDYYAVVCGLFEGEGTIDIPIGLTEDSKIKRWAKPNGERAVTHWTALQNDGCHTLMKIRLETGRTHQIRVHFAYLGAPLLGDTLYGLPSSRIARQALHCKTIRFIHPVTGRSMAFDSVFPNDFKGLI